MKWCVFFSTKLGCLFTDKILFINDYYHDTKLKLNRIVVLINFSLHDHAPSACLNKIDMLALEEFPLVFAILDLNDYMCVLFQNMKYVFFIFFM